MFLPKTTYSEPITEPGSQSRRFWLVLLCVGIVVTAIVVYSYRELIPRQFAADDYQWLLHVQGRSWPELLSNAIDPFAQQHFYRPLIWLAFWLEVLAFGLQPAGFHYVSLILQIGNAISVGIFALRLGQVDLKVGRFWLFALPALFLALHPGPFEAIVWISAQSELIGFGLLFLALHCWITPGRVWPLLATLCLALAMLAKESAILGLPLMLLLSSPKPGLRSRWAYLLPTTLTIGFIWLQLAVERTNTVLRAGLYGFGPQLISNPLRSLALVVAPLTGTEHADANWLVPVGAIVALLLGGLLIWSIYQATIKVGRQVWDLHSWPLSSRLLIAIGLALAPTAPFLSPPDSRYLYLPVALAGLLIGVYISKMRLAEKQWLVHIGLLCGSMFLLWWASGELTIREWRFSAGSGPGASLWTLMRTTCANEQPSRVILIDPPIAAPHIEAIIQLACTPKPRILISDREHYQKLLRKQSLLISFPGGTATIELRQ